MEKLLLHFCCAICGLGIFQELKDKFLITAFWFNPNIYPLEEYQKRRVALKVLSERLNLSVIYDDGYSQEEWLTAVKGFAEDTDRRHLFCYRLRLERTARYAKENGFSYFTSSLLSSPQQKHEEIKKIGKELEEKIGIKFYYQDFRNNYYPEKRKAKEMGLYSQKYCGCLYSLKETRMYTNSSYTNFRE